MFSRGGRRERRELDMERELQADLDQEAAELMEAGMSAGEAREAARRAFGNVAVVKEEVRDMWTWTTLERIGQDLKFGCRALAKNPGFTVTAVLTLTLGIGASTAVFTAVDSVLLRPLSFPESGRLVTLWEKLAFLGPDSMGPNPRHFDLWRQRTTAFSGLTLLRQSATGVTAGTDHPQLTGTVNALPNLFDVLRVKPFLGRGFSPENGVKGRTRVAVLSYAIWRDLFHSDRAAIGKTIRISATVYEVIGVMPEDFHFPNGNALRAFRSKQSAGGVPEPGVFTPLALEPEGYGWAGDFGNFVALGRLGDGVEASQASAQLNTIAAQIVHDHADFGESRPGVLTALAEPMRDSVTGTAGSGLWLLMAAVLGLMLIACLNLANAQLGWAMGRQREAAVRAALGASKWRLAISSVTENAMVALAGGVGGVLLAAWGVSLFRRHSPVDLPRLDEVHLNLTVLLFSAALTIGASLLSGLVPVVRMWRTDPQRTLQGNSARSVGSRQSRGLRTGLIALQVFGCTVLLLVTGLFSKSLQRLTGQDAGFQTARVTAAEVNLPARTYAAGPDRIAFCDAVLGRLRAIPGVEAAGLVSAMPLEGETWIEDLQRTDRPQQKTPLINLRWTSPGYFEAMQTPLVAGRLFEERDLALENIIISEGEAKALWGGGNAAGAEVAAQGKKMTVIGVVADSRNTSLKEAPPKMAWVMYNHRTPASPIFMVRGARSGDDLAPAIRQAIWGHAPDVTITRIKTMDSQRRDSVAPERFETMVLVAFGGAGLLLAMLGIYGVLSYSVAARRQEIGVRMALGATRARIYALVMGEAGVPVVAGLVTGLVASVFAGRAIRSLLFGAEGADASVMLAVCGLFVVAAVAAAYVPARRAASVDPVETMRAD
jgi:predicted permease